MIFFVVLLLVFAFLPTTISASKSTIYVIPNSSLRNSDCPRQHCYTINELVVKLNVTEKLINSNTQIIFLPGDHTVKLNGSLVIKEVSNLEISSNSKTYIEDGNQAPTDRTTAKIVCSSMFRMLFVSIKNLTISNISLTECGAEFDGSTYTLNIAYSSNITIEGVSITNGSGIGIKLYMVDESLTISNSVFTSNDINCYLKVWYFGNGKIFISNSNFSLGKNFVHRETTGIEMNIEESLHLRVNILNVVMLENHGKKGNFNLYIGNSSVDVSVYNLTVTSAIDSEYVLYLDGGDSTNISITASNFKGKSIWIGVDKRTHGNFAYYDKTCSLIYSPLRRPTSLTSNYSKDCFHNIMWPGLGLWLNVRPQPVGYGILEHACRANKHRLDLFLKHTVIKSDSGTGLILDHTNTIIENVTIQDSVGNMAELKTTTLKIRNNCTFHNNKASFAIDSDSEAIFEEGSVTLFANNNIQCNVTAEEKYCSTLHSKGTILLHKNATIDFKNNTGTQSGGLTIEGELILFGKSSLAFTDNTGTNGGAMEIRHGGVMRAKEGISTIKFVRNKAHLKGGAIYVPSDRTFKSICEKSNTKFDALIFNFINNTALLAGSAIYGVWSYKKEIDNNLVMGCSLTNMLIQNKISQKAVSAIASDPVRVCICRDSQPNCNLTHYVEIYPGQSIEIEIVLVGLRFGIVPSVVKAEYDKNEYSWKNFGGGQYLQYVRNRCTKVKYETVIDSIQMKELLLTTNGMRDRSNNCQFHQKANTHLLDQNLIICFKVKTCSLGFTFCPDVNKCKCQQTIEQHGMQCNESLTEILRKVSKWINATYIHNTDTQPGVIVHDHCPFDYCRSDVQKISLNLEYPDDQCAFNRSGTLCGACQTNLSQVFGTSRCKECSNFWVLLYIPLFAIVGFILVASLRLLDLTVSIGTINGLVFYANIVRANQAIFFPPQTTNSFLNWFVAWINLDIGIETCFYDGLDAYIKTWLQFVFPMYIWVIVIAIIVLSRHYTVFARISGSNAVQVLATLFLLSYTKLIRTIITVFQSTTLVYPDGYLRRVWLYDGNVDYLKGKHIPLFIVALLLLMLLSIPYTTILLTIQWLQKRNQYRVLFWVYKLKPLFDAYTSPYKENHCYWTGLLLLVRVVLFLVFSLNTENNPSVNLLAIASSTFILFTHLSLTAGVYESRIMNTFETSFLLNIGLLSVATFYQVNTSGNQTQIIYTSTGISFALFIVIIIYHIIRRLLETRRGLRLKHVVESKFKEKVGNHINAITFTPSPVVAKVSHNSIELKEPLLVSP